MLSCHIRRTQSTLLQRIPTILKRHSGLFNWADVQPESRGLCYVYSTLYCEESITCLPITLLCVVTLYNATRSCSTRTHAVESAHDNKTVTYKTTFATAQHMNKNIRFVHLTSIHSYVATYSHNTATKNHFAGRALQNC